MSHALNQINHRGNQDVNRGVPRKESVKNGRALTIEEKSIYKNHFPDSVLDSARIHDGKVPWYLRKGYEAITRGKRYLFSGRCLYPRYSGWGGTAWT